MLGLQRGHAAHAGGGDGLAIGLVGDVTGGEHAGNIGRGRVRRGDEIAVRFHRQLALEQLGRWRVADGDEDAVDGQVGGFAGFDVFQAGCGDAQRILIADHLFQRRVPEDFDLGVLEQAVLQDLLGAEAFAAVDDGHLGGEIGQEQRLFHGGIAAADNQHFAAPIEEAVARGAGRDAEALEFLLGGKVQPFGLRAGRDDDGIGGIDRAALADCAEGAHVKVDTGDMVVGHFGTHGLGMFLHLDHEFGALDFGKARIVLDIRGDGQLAAGLDAGDDQNVAHGPRAIDSGGPAGRAGADDEDFGVAGIGGGIGHLGLHSNA